MSLANEYYTNGEIGQELVSLLKKTPGKSV